ncbi:MAG TPA: hypothetical protein VLY87_01800 [Flavobacterium sp.]|nr:hypothetical protein [Flavobacterium sp.]
MQRKVQFQTGVDCLGFPIITEHRIIQQKAKVQNGNRHLPKQVFYMDVIQTTFKQY